MRIGAALFVLVATCVNCSNVGPGGSSTAQSLNASIRYAGFNVTIKNDGTQNWTDVRLTLNDRYRCSPLSLNAGASERIRMTTCEADGGAAYDPLTVGLEKVSVTARLSGGGRELTTAFTCLHSLDCVPPASK